MMPGHETLDETLKMTLDREQTLSLGALALILVLCATLVQYAMQTRSEAAQQLDERRETVARLEARARADGPGRTITTAPASAFLDASTQGLAGAQLQAYLTQTAGAQQAAIISSGLEPTKREDTPDTIRLQATFEVGLVALQAILYRLESGTPYVFVEALAVQPAGAAGGRPPEDPLLRATLSVRAFWRRGSS
jgi:general secretion pathway protein M